MPEPRQLSERTPARLEPGVAVPIPDTDLTATLLDRRYGRGRSADGADRVISNARIHIDCSTGATATIEGAFYLTYQACGRLLYLGGSRSETLLYAVDVP